MPVDKNWTPPCTICRNIWEIRIIMYVCTLLAEWGECNQMGSAREPSGFVFRRHDTEDLVHEAGHVRPRPASTQQRNLHHQMEPHGARHPEPKHESYPSKVGHPCSFTDWGSDCALTLTPIIYISFAALRSTPLFDCGTLTTAPVSTHLPNTRSQYTAWRSLPMANS